MAERSDRNGEPKPFFGRSPWWLSAMFLSFSCMRILHGPLFGMGILHVDVASLNYDK